jgi:hypothetical protein
MYTYPNTVTDILNYFRESDPELPFHEFWEFWKSLDHDEKWYYLTVNLSTGKHPIDYK